MATILGTRAQTRWRLYGTVAGVTLDVTFGVPATYSWSRHIEAAKLVDPCTSQVTLMMNTSGTIPPRFGRPVIGLDGPHRAQVAAMLDQAFALGGPWQLQTPTENMEIVCDPTQGDSQWTNNGAYLTLPVGMQEILPFTGAPPPPPAPPPSPTLTATGSTFAPGGNIPVQWANWVSPTVGDFVGLYRPTDPINPSLDYTWQYVFTGAVATGTGVLPVPSFLDAGTYVLRGFYGPAPTVIIGPTVTVT